MLIRFWGVRGSIASPGPETAGVGGNTSCVEVVCGETRFVLDAGTGIRRLGDAWLGEQSPIEATLLLSHLHWDHIQGIPFFVPAYLPSTRLSVMGPFGDKMTLRETLSHQMRAPVFPVRLEELSADIRTRELRGGETFHVGDAVVRTTKTNHPGGGLAYRIEHGGHSVVYATDTEHYACVDPAMRAIADGADVLVYDSQYTPEEYSGDRGRSKVGWGHSTFEAGAALARSAAVGRYVLFHHDPQRDDQAVAAVEARARTLFAASIAAREGMTLTLEQGHLAQCSACTKAA